MSSAMPAHVSYNSWYISLPSSAKQLSELERVFRSPENLNHDDDVYYYIFFIYTYAL